MTYLALSPEDILVADDQETLEESSSNSHSADVLDNSEHLIAILEHHRADLPFADRELSRYQKMHHDLAAHRHNSEEALSQWQEALRERWKCEIAGLRLYMQICHQLAEHFGAESPHLQVIAMSNHGGAATAPHLLADLRRAYLSLTISRACMVFLADQIEHLNEICNALEAAIDSTHYWEEQRRSAVVSQRLCHDAYQRACSHTHHLLAQHLGEQAVTSH